MDDFYYLFEDLDIGSSYEVQCDPLKEVEISEMIRKYLPNVHIRNVKEVNNRFLKDMYDLKKEEYRSRHGVVTEQLLFHATSSSNVESILQDNLDWRRVQRNKYGKGVSFSSDADYANYHSNSGNGNLRAFIVAKVLVSSFCVGNPAMSVPAGKADTAISANMKVLVKFNDNEFLPVYVVYYNAPDKTTSSHHRLSRRRGRRF